MKSRANVSHFAATAIFVLLVMIGCGWPREAWADSVAPAPPSGSYSNSVSFDFVNAIFRLNYQGADGSLTYNYAPGANGSLGQIRCYTNGVYAFRPSNAGGVSMWTSAGEVFPWSAGVVFQLLNAHTNGNTLATRWQMVSGTNSLTYDYQMSISGRTLSIQASVESGVSAGFYLDRCMDAVNPVVVHVPYLTTMNVLFANNLFCTIFFDWEKTGASQIHPLDQVASATSVYYAQQGIYMPRSDGSRQSLSETVYLTVSPSLPDVLPSVINPVSPYRNLASQYLIFDTWLNAFSDVSADTAALHDAGLSNLWVIVHNWQHAGYDNQYPDVMPANPSLGGDTGLKSLSQAARTNGYLFSVHENYVDFYTNAPSWNPAAIARNNDGSLKTAWFNPSTQIQSYETKPTLAANYLTNFAAQIHSAYATTAAFLDVHSAVNPSDKVDYDSATTNAGMLSQTLASYRPLAGLLRAAHQGPVSGEGNNHMFWTGYFDDIEAQINSGGAGPGTQASWLPLLVDFDLNKLHSKALVHGVGYYERFYADQNNNPQSLTFSRDAVLEYMASELAFGHGGFIPSPGRVYDYVDTAKLEQRHVLPAQTLYASATPVSILYHDSASNDEVSVSDFIRRHPGTFATQTNDAYLSQVRVTYNNGVVVCVNRHLTRSWQVRLGYPGGYFNFNATMNGTNFQWVGQTNLTSYLLPPTNGWVVFVPNLTPPKISTFTLTNGAANITITNLFPACTNQIQMCTDLSSNGWQVVDAFVTGGAQTNVSVSVPGGSSQAFFRVARIQ